MLTFLMIFDCRNERMKLHFIFGAIILCKQIIFLSNYFISLSMQFVNIILISFLFTFDFFSWILFNNNQELDKWNRKKENLKDMDLLNLSWSMIWFSYWTVSLVWWFGITSRGWNSPRVLWCYPWACITWINLLSNAWTNPFTFLSQN